MLGGISLAIFFFLLVASFQKWIRQDVLPLQSVLVLGALLLCALALVFGHDFRLAQLFTAATLHPITATIAGFLLAGAVDAAGGFVAAGRVLIKISKGFLGLSGTIVLLVNLPSIFAMPCGRVWAAALIPATIRFGAELARQRNNAALVPAVVFGLIINAAASCGPSPLGGLGMMAEGTAGFDIHAFSNPQQLAIIVITVIAMFGVGLFSKFDLASGKLPQKQLVESRLADSAYFAFTLYMLGLAVVFVVQPPVPIQTILLGMTILVMIVGNVSFKSLLGGLIIHPVTAMVAGFMMAGALIVTGGFDSLITALTWLANNTPLGFIGVSVILVYLPVIFPMPCGRIIAAALLPGVIMFGRKVSAITGVPHCLPVMLVCFILCCAASCAPSPLGGIGGIGEGNLRLRAGVSAYIMQLSIILGVPVAGLIVSWLGLPTEIFSRGECVLALCFGTGAGLLVNVLVGERFYKPGGIVGGLLVGVLVVIL